MVILYFLLALLFVQLVLFTLAFACQLSSRQLPSAAWKANVLSGAGFLVMSLTAFVTLQLVDSNQAFYTWLSGGVFVLFGVFLVKLGLYRREQATRPSKSETDDPSL
jgi:hypothetical protein